MRLLTIGQLRETLATYSGGQLAELAVVDGVAVLRTMPLELPTVFGQQRIMPPKIVVWEEGGHARPRTEVGA